MDNVMAAVEKSFENITISEVLEGPGLLCNLSCISEPVVEG
jgi:hypothetical protein